MNEVIIYTALATTGILLFFMLVGAIALKTKNSERSLKESVLWLINQCWDNFWGFIFLPWTIFKGLFFSLNGAKNPDGSVKRANFSLTRTIFALSCFVMLGRLGMGGKTIEDAKIGPQVIEQKAIYAYQPTTRGEKRRARRARKKARKEKKKVAKAKKRARRKRLRYVGKKAKTRPYLYIKKIQSEPVEFYELLLFLIIAGLYYFRRDLNRGDRGNFLEKGIKLFAEAYAMKISGVDPNASTGDDSGGEEDTEVEISEEELPPPPPPMHEK